MRVAHNDGVERIRLRDAVHPIDERPFRDRLREPAVVTVDHEGAQRVADEVARRPTGDPVALPRAGGALVQMRVKGGVGNQDDIVTDESRSTSASCSACTLAFAASTSGTLP